MPEFDVLAKNTHKIWQVYMWLLGCMFLYLLNIWCLS